MIFDVFFVQIYLFFNSNFSKTYISVLLLINIPIFLSRRYKFSKTCISVVYVVQIIIAGAECRAGAYREARDVVRAMCVSLRASRLAVPRDMRHAIALLHSYILVRNDSISIISLDIHYWTLGTSMTHHTIPRY